MTTEKLIDLRKRVLTGEPVSQEELREALAFLRQDRMTAAPKGKKGKPEVVPLSNDALSNLLEMI